MLRRPRAARRPAALLIPLTLVGGLSAACGAETTGTVGSQQRDDAFEVTGEVGSSPEVTWNSQMQADSVETDVLSEGDGAALAEGDEVLVNYYVGNGYTEKTALDTYAEDLGPAVFPVGGDVPQPAAAQPTDDQVAKYLFDTFVATQVSAEDTVGTRKISTVTSADVIGFGGSALDVGNQDALLLVIDIDSVVKPGPDGAPVKERAPWVPAIVFADGTPSALNFTRATEPDGTLKTAYLFRGTGEPTAKNDVIVVDYLGSVYDAAEPFDTSFGKTPFTTVLGQGAVIEGWDEALVGVPVGSRVMLQIPPAKGYGKDGSGENIPGDSTLYFVIDVLAAG